MKKNKPFTIDRRVPRGGWLRRVLLVLVVVAACSVSYGFGRWWAELRAGQALPPVQQANAAVTDPLAALLPVAGDWSFAELDWSVRSNIVSEAEAAARLEALRAPTASEADANLPEISPDLLELASSLNLQPVQRGGNLVYVLDQQGVRGQLVVRTIAGRPRAVSMAAAFPLGDGAWQLMECTPREAAKQSMDDAAHLLPLPAGSMRHGGRFADDGRLLLELVSVRTAADDLVARWKAAGWEIQPTVFGSPGQFSYLCAQGGEVVYAWSGDMGGTLENLMLVRTPAGVDTDR